jgi:hypothetical protein
VLPIVRQVTEADNALRFALAGPNMNRNIIFTSEAPATPATYSQAVKAAGLRWIWLRARLSSCSMRRTLPA